MTDRDPVEAALSPAQLEAWKACRAPGDMPVSEFADETERSKGTIGNHLARAEDNLADAADEFAAAATPVDFETECQRRSTSWERAAPMADATEIRKLNSYAWAVRLPDGQTHVSVLLRREDYFAGWCDCKGFTYNGGPCAHLCTLRQAAFVHVESDDGDRVRIPEQPPKTPATDGGRIVEPAAGHDGREFGRPETQI